jgi:hypothetical protein
MINISKLSEGNPCLKHGEHTLRDPVRRINLSKERGRRTARVRLSNIQDEPDDAIDRRIRCSPTDTAGKGREENFPPGRPAIG